MNQRDYKKLVKFGRIGHTHVRISNCMFENQNGSIIYRGLIKKNTKYSTDGGNKSQKMVSYEGHTEVITPNMKVSEILASPIIGALKKEEVRKGLEKHF